MIKTFKTIFVVLLTIAIIFGLLKTITGEPKTPEVLAAPKIYAALGDSITQAANACEPYQECPEKSWATGAYSETKNPIFDSPVTIREHLLELRDQRKVEVHNNARSYTKVDDLPKQAQIAVTQKAELVTILSGANDVCAMSEKEITTNKQFRASVKETLDILKTQLPTSKILVASIPNIYTLWKNNHTNSVAVRKWVSADLCNSMLANPTSMTKENQDRRERVLEKIKTFNLIWEQECGQYVNCLYDNNAVFNTVFTDQEISHVDYFHPSQTGQKLLAQKIWSSNLLVPRFVQIAKGKSTRSSEDAPIINVIQPLNKATVSGDKFRLKAKVESINELDKVYADTQLGGVDLEYDPIEDVWYLQVDTTLAPNGLSTFFTVVAVDVKKEVAISEKITVTVDNPEMTEEEEEDIKPTPMVSPTGSPDVDAGVLP